MENHAPNRDALDSLKSFLERRLNKNSITILEPTVIPGKGQDSYSADEIRELEKDYRDEYTEYDDSNILTVYMIIVDGYFNQQNVLGIAYYNTSTAFFGPSYDEASGGLGQASRFLVEATSFRHEFGHLFGLVNIDGSGTDMQEEDHQDDANGHHCDNDQCLMYYAVETTNFFGQLMGEEIPSLDKNCVFDLRANGGK
jgi:predicted Zn-dependent protease